MRYAEIKVKFEKPDIWYRPTNDKISKVGIPYLEYARKILEFDNLKLSAKKEICDTIANNIDISENVNELNQKLDSIFEHYGKAMIPTDEIDDTFLLRKTNANTLAKKLQGWCKNLSYNIPEIIKAKPYANLIGKFKDIPAFVCLAGPSLRNNREKLKGLGKRGIVIVVDTSLRPLLNVGVVPDICVTHDANPNGCKFFLSGEHPFNKENTQLNDLPDDKLGLIYAQLLQDKERLNFKYKTVGLFVNYCHPLTLLAWNGSVKSFYTVFDPGLPVYENMASCVNWKEDIIGSVPDEKDFMKPKIAYSREEKGRVIGGSSVGHVAEYIAVALGCNPISFLGLDLSYPQNMTYVQDASNQKDMSKQRLIEVDSLGGYKVPTNVSMLSYKKVFERSFPSIIMETYIKFYNCTEDEKGNPAGILEIGAEPKSLQWVLDNKCDKEYDFDVLKTLNGEVKI